MVIGSIGELNAHCPLRFYQCPYREHEGDCKKEYPNLPPEVEKPCALGVFETFISPQDRMLLLQDTYRLGYKAVAIEYNLLRLNKADMFIEHEDGLTQSLKRETNKGRFLPLPIKGCKDKSQHRASEFNKQHHCQRIFSKIDHKKLGFPDNPLARIGTAYHAVCNLQHRAWIEENDTLKELGISPINRAEYCEVGLRYVYKDIVVSAHADCCMQYLPNGLTFCKDIGTISVLDMKRKAYSTYEEFGHKLQLTANVLGIDHIFKAKSKEFFLITSKRPRKEVVGRYRMPEFHITKIASDGPTMRSFHNTLMTTHIAQVLLLDNRNIWNQNKTKYSVVGDCKSCFDKDVCDHASDIMNKNKLYMRETLEDVLKAVLPNKELPGT